MAYRKWQTMDKSDWVYGPWTREPDRVHWIHESTGFPCIVSRNSLGALSGFVGVSESHTWHGVSYWKIPQPNVHGGLFHSYYLTIPEGIDDIRLSSHFSFPELDAWKTMWWFGFSAAREQDLWPAQMRPGDAQRTYYQMYMAINDCDRLAVHLDKR